MPRKPILLMIDAGHFEVSYVINPWMKPTAWSENPVGHFRAAQAASAALEKALAAAGAEVMRLPGAAGEEALFLEIFDGFKTRGLFDTVAQFPEGCFQEGAGDCIWDATRQRFWAGFGQRSVREAAAVTADFFGVPVTPLELVSSRFYHLDTCFLSLSGGEIVYYPKAFSPEALVAIRAAVAPENLIEADDEDAAGFCVNAVNMGRQIVMAQPKDGLRARLVERGYTVTGVDLSPFIMAGGGAYCMTLRLDRAREAKRGRLA